MLHCVLLQTAFENVDTTESKLCVPRVSGRCSLCGAGVEGCGAMLRGQARMWVSVGGWEPCWEPVLCKQGFWWWFRRVGPLLGRSDLQSFLGAGPQWTMHCSGQVEFDFKCLDKWNFSERRVENWNAEDKVPVRIWVHWMAKEKIKFPAVSFFYRENLGQKKSIKFICIGKCLVRVEEN